VKAPAVVAVAAGGRHSLAVLADGTVMSWGANDHGQLGHGRSGSKGPGRVIAPDGEPGNLHDVVAIAADTDFSMALRSDGTVVTWGTGDAGQRGTGQNKEVDHPTVVKAMDGKGPLRDVIQIAADGRTELALLKDGRVMSWGANRFGMLGDGTRISKNLPVFVVSSGGTEPLADVKQVSIGGQNGLAVLNDGTLVAWGHNDRGQLGNGSLKDRPVPGPVVGMSGTGNLVDVVQVSAAEKHAFALRGDGTVVAWGNNSAGQLGDGTLQLRMWPVSVLGGGGGPELRGVKRVAAGEAYGAAILDDGSLRTWGANGSGQLGSGDRVPRSEPGPVAVRAGLRLKGVEAVAAGERHLLVLSSGHTDKK